MPEIANKVVQVFYAGDAALCSSMISIYVKVRVATVQILCVDGDREIRRIWRRVVEFYPKWIC